MYLTNYHFYPYKKYSYGKPVKGLQSYGVGYRFSFNGKEKDNEGMGGGGSTYDYGFRIYNAQLGRFLSVDPLTKSYPWNSTYSFAENDVISCIDIDGLEKWKITDVELGDGTIRRTYNYDPNRKPLEDGSDFLYINKRGFPEKISKDDPFNNPTARAMAMKNYNYVEGRQAGEFFYDIKPKFVLNKTTSKEVEKKVENNIPSVEPETPFSPDIVVTNKNKIIPDPKPKPQIVNFDKAAIWTYESYKKHPSWLFEGEIGKIFNQFTKDKGIVSSITISVLPNNNHAIENHMLKISLENKFKAKDKAAFKVVDKIDGDGTNPNPDFSISLQYEKFGVKR